MTVPVKLAIKNFRKDTFIMIEGKSDDGIDVFFIVKSGIVRITREFNTIYGDDRGEQYKEGDFFGLISCMSGHSREESAYALTDVTLILVKRDQFGFLIQSNASIAMRILRVFSSNLRYIDDRMTSQEEESDILADDESPKEKEIDNEELDREQLSEQIYNIGTYYESIKQYNQAVYAYIRYIEYAPDGNYVQEAKTKLQSLTPLAKDALNPGNNEIRGWQRDFVDNTFIFCEHEKGGELYVIQKGQVKITKLVNNQEQVIAVLKPGDIFGEMALLNEKPRSASAIAFGEVNTLYVNKANFEMMVKSEPQLVTKLITLLSERIWTGYRQLAIKLIKNPVVKMLDLLLLQVEKEMIPIDRTSHIFNFGLTELSGLAGLSKEESKEALVEILKLKTIDLSGEDKRIKCSNLFDLQKEVNILKTKERREAKKQQKPKQ